MLQRIPRVISLSALRTIRSSAPALQYRAIHPTHAHSKIMGIAEMAEKVMGKSAVEAVTGQTPAATASAEVQVG